MESGQGAGTSTPPAAANIENIERRKTPEIRPATGCTPTFFNGREGEYTLHFERKDNGSRLIALATQQKNSAQGSS